MGWGIPIENSFFCTKYQIPWQNLLTSSTKGEGRREKMIWEIFHYAQELILLGSALLTPIILDLMAVYSVLL